MKKMMLIINPAAGRGGYKYDLGEALYILSKGGYVTSLFFTTRPGEGTELAEKYAGYFDVVTVIGGDGSLSDVLSGLMRISSRPPIGYIPMGTANDVATTLGLPKNDTRGAARRITEGIAHPFDVGLFADDKYFAYIAAFGAFTDVSYNTPQDQKKVLGHLAYVLQGAAQLGKIESINARVEYDSGSVEGRFLYGSMSNSTSVAGIISLPENMVCLGDGISELVLVKDPGNLVALGEIVDSVLSQRFDSDNLLILHTKEAKFIFEKPVAWTRDGEAGGEYTEVTLKNCPSPVSLIF